MHDNDMQDNYSDTLYVVQLQATDATSGNH